MTTLSFTPGFNRVCDDNIDSLTVSTVSGPVETVKTVRLI